MFPPCVRRPHGPRLADRRSPPVPGSAAPSRVGHTLDSVYGLNRADRPYLSSSRPNGDPAEFLIAPGEGEKERPGRTRAGTAATVRPRPGCRSPYLLQTSLVQLKPGQQRVGASRHDRPSGMHCCCRGKQMPRLVTQRPSQQSAVSAQPSSRTGVQVARRQVQLAGSPAVSILVQPQTPLRQSDGVSGSQGLPTPAGAHLPLVRHLPLQHWASRRHVSSRPRQVRAAAPCRTPTPTSAAPSVPNAARLSNRRRVSHCANCRISSSKYSPSIVALLGTLDR